MNLDTRKPTCGVNIINPHTRKCNWQSNVRLGKGQNGCQTPNCKLPIGRSLLLQDTFLFA